MSLFSIPSIFSGSHRKNYYRNGHHGSGRYKRDGLLGGLLDLVASHSHSGRYYGGYGQPLTDRISSQCMSTLSGSKPPVW